MTGPKPYTSDYLKTRIVKLIKDGLTYTDISKRMGLHSTTVSRIASDMGVAYVSSNKRGMSEAKNQRKSN